MAVQKLYYTHLEHMMASHNHGHSVKHHLVLHETVTPDIVGLVDIWSVASSLAKRDYGIHGMTDKEGHIAHAYGLGEAIFYHAGGLNTTSCGLEQVSLIPALIQNKTITKDQAWKMWLARSAQLVATAKYISAWHNTDPKNRPLRRSNGTEKSWGVCSHWDVSQHYAASDGHWDCQPHDKGGHYPLAHVIAMAVGYQHFGYHF